MVPGLLFLWLLVMFILSTKFVRNESVQEIRRGIRPSAINQGIAEDFGAFKDSRIMIILILRIRAIIMVWSILAVELTLAWNHISGVYTVSTVGQLIPLVIGLSGSLETIYEILKEVRFCLAFRPAVRECIC